MRAVIMIVSALVLTSSAVFSQGALDVYKMSQTDITGTARYVSMGGAFGALGGDISAMHTNPAGLAVYRSSEIVTTLSTNIFKTETNWWDTKTTDRKTRFNFDNIAYVGYFPTSKDEGILGWNVGFSYNRMKNFNRKYTARDFGGEDYSLSDYTAARANVNGWSEYLLEGGEEGYNPYDNREVFDWLSIMAYNAYFINPLEAGGNQYTSSYRYDDGTSIPIDNRELYVNEKGATDLYNISFGMNISDIVMVGATVAITDINYRYVSQYTENFGDNSYLYLDNWLETEGTGYSFNLGVIARPVDFLRVGVAYTSPTWYDMTDYYYAEGEKKSYSLHSTPEFAHTNYDLRSPDKWLFSVAGIIGSTALISVDYELTNYKNMKMYDDNGREDLYTNGEIKRNFGLAGTLRVGAEVKVTPQFAVRAGGAWIGNPMKSNLKNVEEEVQTVGTLPHFTTQKSLANYSVGLGYRFTPGFYMDLACVFKTQKEKLFAYSNMYEAGNIVESGPSTLKTNTTRLALTFGYKF